MRIKIFVISLLFIGIVAVSCKRGVDSDRVCPAVTSRSSQHVHQIGREIPKMSLDAFYKGKIQRINLSQYKGKWLILFFYPADLSRCPALVQTLKTLLI